MPTAAPLNRGMVVDVVTGQSIELHPPTAGSRIVITIEHKSGQRARLRIQSDEKVKVDPPKAPVHT